MYTVAAFLFLNKFKKKGKKNQLLVIILRFF